MTLTAMFDPIFESLLNSMNSKQHNLLYIHYFSKTKREPAKKKKDGGGGGGENAENCFPVNL